MQHRKISTYYPDTFVTRRGYCFSTLGRETDRGLPVSASDHLNEQKATNHSIMSTARLSDDKIMALPERPFGGLCTNR
jgi:hypothetical protein